VSGNLPTQTKIYFPPIIKNIIIIEFINKKVII